MNFNETVFRKITDFIQGFRVIIEKRVQLTHTQNQYVISPKNDFLGEGVAVAMKLKQLSRPLTHQNLSSSGYFFQRTTGIIFCHFPVFCLPIKVLRLLPFPPFLRYKSFQENTVF